MIGRERIKEIKSIEEIDSEINERQTHLNKMVASLLPQIISEEIVELRARRSEIEDQMVTRMVRETGRDRIDCRVDLIQHGWHYEQANPPRDCSDSEHSEPSGSGVQ